MTGVRLSSRPIYRAGVLVPGDVLVSRWDDDKGCALVLSVVEDSDAPPRVVHLLWRDGVRRTQMVDAGWRRVVEEK